MGAGTEPPRKGSIPLNLIASTVSQAPGRAGLPASESSGLRGRAAGRGAAGPLSPPQAGGGAASQEAVLPGFWVSAPRTWASVVLRSNHELRQAVWRQFAFPKIFTPPHFPAGGPEVCFCSMPLAGSISAPRQPAVPDPSFAQQARRSAGPVLQVWRKVRGGQDHAASNNCHTCPSRPSPFPPSPPLALSVPLRPSDCFSWGSPSGTPQPMSMCSGPGRSRGVPAPRGSRGSSRPSVS